MHGMYLIYVCGSLAILATIAVILRAVARRKIQAGFRADDWWVTFSLVPMYGMVICGGFLAIKGGAGRPITSLTPSESHAFFLALFASLPIYGLAITMAKISLLLLYRGLFDTRPFRIATAVVGAACLAWFLAEIFTTLFQCAPFYGAFDKSLPARCINLVSIFYAFSASNMFLDVVILCMPIRSAWRLPLPRRQKITMSGVFFLGGLTCIAAIARMTSVRSSMLKDITLHIVHPYIFSTLEPAMAIICACLPLLRPLFTRIPSVSETLPRTAYNLESCSGNGHDDSRQLRGRILQRNDHAIGSQVLDRFDPQGDRCKLVTITERSVHLPGHWATRSDAHNESNLDHDEEERGQRLSWPMRERPFAEIKYRESDDSTVPTVLVGDDT